MGLSTVEILPEVGMSSFHPVSLGVLPKSIGRGLGSVAKASHKTKPPVKFDGGAYRDVLVAVGTSIVL